MLLTIMGRSTSPVDGALATISYANLPTVTSGMFDGTTNLLTGSARTAYLGTHGSEVA